MEEFEKVLENIDFSGSVDIIMEFIQDFDLNWDIFDDDLSYHIKNSIPENFTSSTAFPPDNAYWGLQHYCIVCDKDDESRWECYALICSRSCFQTYYRKDRKDLNFKNRVIELHEAVKIFTQVLSLYNELDIEDYEGLEFGYEDLDFLWGLKSFQDFQTFLSSIVGSDKI